MRWSPVRVDFAGGWLDVPRLARPDGCIVNCTVMPGLSLQVATYQYGGGVGGSAAASLLRGEDPFHTELEAGVGWQDPAVLLETGLCVWQSGPGPRLLMKVDPDWLEGRMALRWSGRRHVTAGLVDGPRDYERIVYAGALASVAVQFASFDTLCEAVSHSHEAQVLEGMQTIPLGGAAAVKYCGAGWGGYELHLFCGRSLRDAFVRRAEGAIAIEPYMRPLVTKETDYVVENAERAPV